MDFSTPDLSDHYPAEVRVLDPVFRCYGSQSRFMGQIVTIRCFEDNSKVKELAAQKGEGRVMVVDGGASLRKALLGDQIAEAAVKNGWSGFVINGCIRDVEAINTLSLGVRALNSIPVKTEKKNLGDVNVPVTFAGQTIAPGEFLYADLSGVVVAARNLVS